LPSVAELASLVDPTVTAPGPTLPPGHPFLNVLSSDFWSATTLAETPTRAWSVRFGDGVVNTDIKTSNLLRVWCVRGGMQESVY